MPYTCGMTADSRDNAGDRSVTPSASGAVSAFVALACPQCGGVLPHQARWRVVECPYCGSLVTRSESVVEAAAYHRAWLRSRPDPARVPDRVELGGALFAVGGQLGRGLRAEVFWGRRLDTFPERVVLKRALPGLGAGIFTRERETLKVLQAMEGPGSAYYSRRFPQEVAWGIAADGRETLVTRCTPGYWGSLTDAMEYRPRGMHVRHVVWIWRRILDQIGYLHGKGYTHGDLRAEHLLVHPRDHGVQLIGWNRARPDVNEAAVLRDLQQSAWTTRWLLAGGEGEPPVPDGLPQPLARLWERACDDRDWCLALGAGGLDNELLSAAGKALGPPRYVIFDPLRPTGDRA